MTNLGAVLIGYHVRICLFLLPSFSFDLLNTTLHLKIELLLQLMESSVIMLFSLFYEGLPFLQLRFKFCQPLFTRKQVLFPLV